MQQVELSVMTPVFRAAAATGVGEERDINSRSKQEGLLHHLAVATAEHEELTAASLASARRAEESTVSASHRERLILRRGMDENADEACARAHRARRLILRGGMDERPCSPGWVDLNWVDLDCFTSRAAVSNKNADEAAARAHRARRLRRACMDERPLSPHSVHLGGSSLPHTNSGGVRSDAAAAGSGGGESAAVEDVVAKIEHETPAPAPTDETGEAESPAGSDSPDCVAQLALDEPLGCFSGDRHAHRECRFATTSEDADALAKRFDIITATPPPESPTSSCESSPMKAAFEPAGSARDSFCHLEYGVARMCGRKGEDRTSMAFVSKLACFGVFDGHGGAEAAQHSAEALHHLVLDEAEADADDSAPGAVSAPALTRAFEGVNEDICAQRAHRAGAAAVCLYVTRPDAATGAVDITCGWVGDSEAVALVQSPAVPALSPTVRPGVGALPPPPSFAYSLSSFDVAPPPAGLAAYDASDASAASSGSRASSSLASTDLTSLSTASAPNDADAGGARDDGDAAKKGAAALGPGRFEKLTSATHVANDRAEQKRIKAALADEVARTAAAAARGEESAALIGVRFVSRGSAGRTCLFADWAAPDSERSAAEPAPAPTPTRGGGRRSSSSSSDGGGRRSSSRSTPHAHTTRSLGDRALSRLVVAQPGVRQMRLHAGERARVLLASGGVWDALSYNQLRAVVKTNAAMDAHACATAVMRAARACAVAKGLRARRGDGGFASDEERAAAVADAKRCCADLTVVVVDVESGLPGQSGGAAPAASTPESHVRERAAGCVP